MKLLFICTHNQCRSIIAEAVANHCGEGDMEARSAGSEPSGQVHPLSIRYLSAAGIDTSRLSSQSWDEHEAWRPDLVITVCDQAAAEPCPVWFGDALQAHWGLADPSRLEGSEEEIAAAFEATINTLESRITALASYDLQSMDRDQLLTLLNTLGEN
ncbi:MAG: arsenate reductase ArsC [Halieaceae bacterium]|jgi:arsenate reductase|nr:arsenate reductase ArsC [Halieaceae bacterium]MBT6126659.1 arsenate reductase ArsC [Halieaceae bacterium]